MKWLRVAFSTAVRNMIINHFQALVLHKTRHNPAFLHTFFDRKFVHCHVLGLTSCVTLAIQFTKTCKQTSYLAFLITRKTFTLSTKVDRNLTAYCSYHLPHVKAGDIQSLHYRATIICQGNQNLTSEMVNSYIICHYGLYLTLHQFYSHTSMKSSLQKSKRNTFG